MLELGFFDDLYEINMVVNRLKTILFGSFKHYNTMALNIEKIKQRKQLYYLDKPSALKS